MKQKRFISLYKNISWYKNIYSLGCRKSLLVELTICGHSECVCSVLLQNSYLAFRHPCCSAEAFERRKIISNCSMEPEQRDARPRQQLSASHACYDGNVVSCYCQNMNPPFKDGNFTLIIILRPCLTWISHNTSAACQTLFCIWLYLGGCSADLSNSAKQCNRTMPFPTFNSYRWWSQIKKENILHIIKNILQQFC